MSQRVNNPWAIVKKMIMNLSLNNHLGEKVKYVNKKHL